MICKSEGIILQVTDFQETSVIVQIYSRDFGKKGFLIQGARSPKSRKLSIIRELNLIDFVFYQKSTRSLQKITEVQGLFLWPSIHSDLEKLSVSLSFLEIFKLSIQEEELSDPELYDWLKMTFSKMDLAEKNWMSIFIKAWMELQAMLGISADYHGHDWQLSREPAAIYGDETEQWMAELSNLNIQESSQLLIPIKLRKHLINRLIQHYYYHFNQHLYPKSLSTLIELGFIEME